MNREEAISAIRNSKWKSAAAHLGQIMQPSLRLRCELTDAVSLPLGASHFGGPADVPRQFEWPTLEPSRKKSLISKWVKSRPIQLDLVAQIDLAAVREVWHDAPLPETGWLCFFYDFTNRPWGYDPNHAGAWRVVHFDGKREDLVRMSGSGSQSEFPAELCRVEFSREWTLPEEPGVSIGQEDSSGTYEELRTALRNNSSFGDTLHRLFGEPEPIQFDMRLDCQLASNKINVGEGSGMKTPYAQSLRAGAADWRLLLQIDSDENGPGWMWGDCGRIYYWIRNQDLLERRFDRVWFALQCY